MKKKNLSNQSTGSIVYSTSTTKEVPIGVNQKLRVRVEGKHHGGKTVTLIDGFIWHIDKIEEIAKKLKTKCGVGGTVKDRVIILQGDMKEKVLLALKAEGHDVK